MIEMRQVYEKVAKEFLYKGKWLTMVELSKLPECIVTISTIKNRMHRALNNEYANESVKAVLTNPSKTTNPINGADIMVLMDWHNKMIKLWHVGSLAHLAKPCSCKEYV